MNQSPEVIEDEQKFSQAQEQGVETHENEHIKGAEMLEEPAGSNFTQGLQTFVAWVKTLLAK